MRKNSPYLIILAVVLVLFANFGFWLSRTIYNPENFSNLVVKTYEQPEVRNAIAAEIVDNALDSKPLVKQVLADPIQSAIAGILNSQTFKSVLQKVAVRFQNYLTTNNRQDVTIEVGQLATFIKAAGTTISPELGAQVPAVTTQTITLVKSNSLPNINKWLKPIMTISPIVGLASILLLIYLVYKSDDKVLILKRLSLYFLIGIFLFGLLIPYFRTVLAGNTADQNAQVIAIATYDTFANQLVYQLVVLEIVFAFIYLGTYVFGIRKKPLEDNK